MTPSTHQVRPSSQGSPTTLCSGSIEFTIRVRRDLSKSELCCHKSSPSVILCLLYLSIKHLGGFLSFGIHFNDDIFRFIHFFFASSWNTRTKNFTSQSSFRSPRAQTLSFLHFSKLIFIEICMWNFFQEFSLSSLMLNTSLSYLYLGIFLFSRYYGMRMCWVFVLSYTQIRHFWNVQTLDVEFWQFSIRHKRKSTFVQRERSSLPDLMRPRLMMISRKVMLRIMLRSEFHPCASRKNKRNARNVVWYETQDLRQLARTRPMVSGTQRCSALSTASCPGAWQPKANNKFSTCYRFPVRNCLRVARICLFRGNFSCFELKQLAKRECEIMKWQNTTKNLFFEYSTNTPNRKP